MSRLCAIALQCFPSVPVSPAQMIDAEGIFGASSQKKGSAGIHEDGEVQGRLDAEGPCHCDGK